MASSLCSNSSASLKRSPRAKSAGKLTRRNGFATSVDLAKAAKRLLAFVLYYTGCGCSSVFVSAWRREISRGDLRSFAFYGMASRGVGWRQSAPVMLSARADC